ncbi:2-hydroxychromene-2-carboxylate isomerase [Pyxidicoccus xibeiensis]|uniref:2-hydroxychromene-2-carboxylate isomerase n=1 Tax=Pyxidicoccus xibeiensis TaxID=2906759 RepID=UPI0020A702F1|nr:DsbA family protein [Pyxidicoccus xibeiensis]MCP3140178.1 2-hydroxychromene-2-carboxylate isomerase [Pyxidicoccus xibeiensis]
MEQDRTLEFWFEFGSTYSYVGAMRVEEACRAAGVPLVWKPFLLGPLFTAQLGIKDSPFNVNPVRGKYMWRDLERLCAKHGLPWRRPAVFPRASVLPLRVACAGEGQPWLGDFIRGVFRANFAEDRDIAEAAVLADVLKGLGVDPEPVLAQAVSADVKARLRANTEQAAALGIFGAPNCVTRGELFFGQDRMDDAIAWALAER